MLFAAIVASTNNQEIEDKKSELNQLTMEIEKLSKFKSVIQAQNNRVSPDHVSYEELDDLRVNEF